MRDIAFNLLKLAKCIISETSLDGMSKVTAARQVNQLLSHYTKGFFSDDSWKAVNDIWTALGAAQIDWRMTGSQYLHNERGQPSGKQWKFEVNFITNKGRPMILYGIVTASGAGSIESPLERYDLVAYVS